MLTICNDPAGAAGFQRFDLDYLLTLQQNIERHTESGADYSLYINGQMIEAPAECDDLDRLPTFCDRVVMVRRPAGWGEVIVAVIAILSAVVSYMMMPDVSNQQPAIPNDVGGGKNSPNNQLTGQTNLARTYQAVPDIYGQVRAYPDLVQQTVEEYIDNVKYLTELMCIGRGLYHVENVKYADTLLSDVAGASYQLFFPEGSHPGPLPEKSVTNVADVWEPFRSPEVNGQEIVTPGDADISTVELNSIEISGGTPFTTIRLTVGDGPDSVLGQQLTTCLTMDIAASFSYNDACTDFSGDEPVPYPVNSGSIDEVVTISSRSWVGDEITINFNRSGNWPLPNPCHTSTAIDFEVIATIQPLNSEPVWMGPYIAPSPNATDLWWNVEFLRGLRGSIQVEYEWWKITDAGAEIAGTRESAFKTFTAQTSDQKFYTVKTTPAAGAGRYRFRVRRITPIIGDGTFDVAKLTALFAMRYYANKTFPGVTMVRVTTQATEQATGIKDRRFNALVTRYCLWHTGAFSATRDFRRAIWHMFTVMADKAPGMIDLDSLENAGWTSDDPTIQNRFDFSFDDKDVSLGMRLQTAANCCRAQVFRDGQRWMFARDRIRNASTPALQFDYRNLAAGAEATRIFRGTLPGSKDGVKVEYTDPDTNKRTSYGLRISQAGAITVGVPDHPHTIQLAGCRTHEQAFKRAHYEARRMIHQRETVSDTALSDASLASIGNLVRWIDPQDWYADGGIWAGEVLQVVTSGADLLIRTSEPVAITAASSGSITTAEGVPSSVFTAWPRTDGIIGFKMLNSGAAAENVFAASGLIQCGARYAIGPGVSETTPASLYILTSKKPTGDGRVGIELVNYDSRIYEMDGEEP